MVRAGFLAGQAGGRAEVRGTVQSGGDACLVGQVECQGVMVGAGMRVVATGSSGDGCIFARCGIKGDRAQHERRGKQAICEQTFHPLLFSTGVQR